MVGTPWQARSQGHRGLTRRPRDEAGQYAAEGLSGPCGFALVIEPRIGQLLGPVGRLLE
jgi:hypothetical protein